MRFFEKMLNKRVEEDNPWKKISEKHFGFDEKTLDRLPENVLDGLRHYLSIQKTTEDAFNEMVKEKKTNGESDEYKKLKQDWESGKSSIAMFRENPGNVKLEEVIQKFNLGNLNAFDRSQISELVGQARDLAELDMEEENKYRSKIKPNVTGRPKIRTKDEWAEGHGRDTLSDLMESTGRKILKSSGIRGENLAKETDVNSFKFKTGEDVKDDSLEIDEEYNNWIEKEELMDVFEDFKNKTEQKLAYVADNLPVRQLFFDLYLREIKTLDSLMKYLHLKGKKSFRPKNEGAKFDVQEIEKDVPEKLEDKDRRFPESVESLIKKYRLNNLEKEDRENLLEAIDDIEEMRKKIGIGFAYHYLKVARKEREKKEKKSSDISMAA